MCASNGAPLWWIRARIAELHRLASGAVAAAGQNSVTICDYFRLLWFRKDMIWKKISESHRSGQTLRYTLATAQSYRPQLNLIDFSRLQD